MLIGIVIYTIHVILFFPHKRNFTLEISDSVKQTKLSHSKSFGCTRFLGPRQGSICDMEASKRCVLNDWFGLFVY